MLSRRAALVVCLYWLDIGYCYQRCVRVFHHDVRTDVWERAFYKLAHLHAGFILWEPVYNSTSEGELPCSSWLPCTEIDFLDLIKWDNYDNSNSSGPWFCCFRCTRSEESWAGGIWRTTDRWESAMHRYFHIKVFAKNYTKKTNYFLLPQILTRCVQWEGTAHAAFISHRPPQTSRGWETTWLKSRKCSLSYGKSSVGTWQESMVQS